MITHLGRPVTRLRGSRSRAAAVVGPLLAAAALAGCSDGLAVSLSDPQTVTARVTPTASDPASDGARTPGAQTSDAQSPSDGPTTEATTRRAAKAWGGGTRVGTYRTHGTVVGDDGTGRNTRIVVGTCDLAHDVRTVTATLDRGGVLVVHVTGKNLGSLELKVPGDPVRKVEYVGDATPVITLTPTRTEVHGALLVPPAGSDAAPVRLDASFDC